jgi:hypothetical protein
MGDVHTPRKRKPRGYVGKGHETIGSDILAVMQILKMPEQVLGVEEVQRLSAVKMDEWYPIEWLLDLMDKVDKELGQYGLLQMGRRLFAMSHEERVAQVARSAADVIYGIDGMYHHANRGSGIGGWKVVRFDPGYAELEKTTPHHCVMEQGILTGALAAVKCPGIVSQKQCFRQGADSCLYCVTSSFTDERWFGGRAQATAVKPPASSPKLTVSESASRLSSASSRHTQPTDPRPSSGSLKVAPSSASIRAIDPRPSSRTLKAAEPTRESAPPRRPSRRPKD